MQPSPSAFPTPPELCSRSSRHTSPKTYATDGSYDVTLTVSDGEETGQATTRVVGSTAPDVEILTPADESKYNAGDTISFSGNATDSDDTLLDSAYRWTVVFLHADHVHPVANNIVGKSGSITVPRPAQRRRHLVRDHLTVTDSTGLSTSKSVEVRPNLVTLTVAADDPEEQFTIDGKPYTGSYRRPPSWCEPFRGSLVWPHLFKITFGKRCGVASRAGRVAR